MIRKQILAFGGGGFSMEPENPALEKYLLRQAANPRPQVCFLATASGDAESYILKFYEAFLKLDCRPSHLSLFRLPGADLEKFLLEKDILYVGGGNTRSMLALWREWGLDRILRKAYERGVVLAGISAGANCWFEECITDSVPGDLRPLPCLGFLRGSFCPHYDGEAERRPAFHRLLGENKILPGYAADDGAAVHFVDGEPFAMVSSRPNARVYKLSKSREEAVEEIQDTRYLNG
jgi:dipeptidase E